MVRSLKQSMEVDQEAKMSKDHFWMSWFYPFMASWIMATKDYWKWFDQFEEQLGNEQRSKRTKP